MTRILNLNEIEDSDKASVGGKGFSLASMIKNNISVPKGVCVTTQAYDYYVEKTGIRERIIIELNRKSFDEMRWEEMWDASLRIRNMFLNTPIPKKLVEELKPLLQSIFLDKTVVVRSSAPGEDTSKTSFAGLHESYVNIKGIDSILDHMKQVWASLWSDAALLYRKELNLDIESSTIAVVIQEIVIGEKSGVIFSVSPDGKPFGVLEAVYGLNKGLVDGTIEPDRWNIDRSTGKILSHISAKREKMVIPSSEGTKLKSLPTSFINTPPLNNEQLSKIANTALKIEKLFSEPQDIEWTLKNNELYILQSRPITTIANTQEDSEKQWQMSLRRSFDNLRVLRKKIEEEIIPGMKREAELLQTQDITKLSDNKLSHEVERRSGIYEKWKEVYWKDLIPFAHGFRLFGQIYNDIVRPKDPYEFIDLLTGAPLKSIERNQLLFRLADIIRTDPELTSNLRNRNYTKLRRDFKEIVDRFITKFGDPTIGSPQKKFEATTSLLLRMASSPPKKSRLQKTDIKKLVEKYLVHFKGSQKNYAKELLDLGRASYRLRDDDNIYLGRIEAQLHSALEETRNRLNTREGVNVKHIDVKEAVEALTNKNYVFSTTKQIPKKEMKSNVRARQLRGQPAGPGVATGKARVIIDREELFKFNDGEILVCDAIDPNMTFIIPLASAIVERRGGMLVHGAIIAREYGLPCVTGVPEVTNLIKTGDQLTVDGYLGIVIITNTKNFHKTVLVSK